VLVWLEKLIGDSWGVDSQKREAAFLSTINYKPSTNSTNFSVKEKDEASPMNCFHRDSSDAFIPCFAGIGGFLF
jgi:hypothetical protein